MLRAPPTSAACPPTAIISPEHPFPSPHQARRRLAEDGVALAERLCVYPRFIDPEWIAPRVLDVIRERYHPFIPRRGEAGTSPATLERARDGRPLAPDELAALFAESRPEVIEDMRQAADELRAELGGRHGDVRRQPQHQRLERLHRRLRVLRLRRGRRSPDAYEHDRLVRRVHDAVAFGATEICMQSGIHPDWKLEDYLGWLRLAKETAPQPPARLQPDGDRAHVRHRPPAAGRGARAARGGGVDSVPGTAAEVLDDGVRQRISPNKLPVARWVEIIEAAHGVGRALR